MLTVTQPLARPLAPVYLDNPSSGYETILLLEHRGTGNLSRVSVISARPLNGSDMAIAVKRAIGRPYSYLILEADSFPYEF